MFTLCSAAKLLIMLFSPSCWDGVYAEDGDYSSHVGASYPKADIFSKLRLINFSLAYPTDNTNGYYCPKGEPSCHQSNVTKLTCGLEFPKKFITIQFETVFAVYDFPYNGDNQITWVLGNGDTSGVRPVTL